MRVFNKCWTFFGTLEVFFEKFEAVAKIENSK